jgi:ATP synthase protein I
VKASEGLVRVEPINHLLKLQVIALVIIVSIIFVWQGMSASIAYAYGGGIAIANTLLQRWHLLAAAKFAKADAGKNLGRAYRCVAERWALTIILFAIGFSVLKPSALMLLVGFIVAQVIVLFGNYNRT